MAHEYSTNNPIAIILLIVLSGIPIVLNSMQNYAAFYKDSNQYVTIKL